MARQKPGAQSEHTTKSVAELERLISKGDEAGCQAFFTGLTEQERRPFASAAEAAFKTERKTWMIEVAPGSFKSNPALEAATVAVFSCCSFATLKTLGWAANLADDELIAILSDRRPDWCEAYAEHLLDRDHPRWSAVRAMMKAGLCGKPKHDNYIVGMLHYHTGVGEFLHRQSTGAALQRKNRGVLDHLLEEPDLLDDIWRIFALEGGGEFSLATHDKYSAAGHARWSDSLVELSRRGVIPRERLLDASLTALDRGFAQFRAGWFSAFHELLQPSIAERTCRSEQYLRLLASPIPPTVSFALRAVELIDRNSSLDSIRLIESLEPVLLSRAKSTAKTALKLLDRVAGRDRKAAERACLAATQALVPQNADVQSAVLAFLEKHAPAEGGQLRDAVARHVDSVAASLQGRLRTWLNGAAEPAPDSKSSVPAKSTGSNAALRSRVARLPEVWRELAGVEQALKALQEGQLDLRACPFNGSDIPRLDPDRAIVALSTLDDLIDAAAAALESPDGYDDIERVLDGISRLCDLRPGDFEQRTGPVRKRCKQLLSRSHQLPFYGDNPHAHLIGVILAWVSRDQGTFRATKQHNHPAVEYRIDGELHHGYTRSAKQPTEPLGIRAQHLANRAAQSQAAVLLSAPTHAGGWINPAALVDRVRAMDGAQPHDLDCVLALLRLAPDGRDQALAMLKGLRGEFASACRYALGGNAAPEAEPAWLWAAASRARSPWQVDERLASLKTIAGPDCAVPAQVDFTIVHVRKFPRLRLQVRPDLPRDIDCRWLTLWLWRHARDAVDEPFEYEGTATIRGAQSIWPPAMEAVCASGTRKLAGNLDWWSANWANRTYLEPLLDPDLPLREMARLLVVLGLVAKEPGERGLATNVCINAIGDGRLDGEQLGKTMLRLWPDGLIKLSRWADSLGQVARASTMHAEIVRTALDFALHTDPKHLRADLHALLALMLELIHETGGSVTPAARNYLSGIKGSGKTARLVKDILSHSGTPSAKRVAEVMQQAADSRIARAERWQARQA